MINFVKQDLTISDADYICHQVNCQGKMNSGIAKTIREKWPIVYTTYLEFCDKNIPKRDFLGNILYVDINNYTSYKWSVQPIIVNMFAQENYGYDGKRYTSYDAFWSCLGYMRESIPTGSKIAFPYKIGCDRGGANWNVIYAMLAAALDDDYEVEICYLEEDEWIKNRTGE